MAEIFDALRLLIEQIILTFGYPGVAFVMFMENIFPPMPSEMMMVLTGLLISEGRLSLTGVLLSGVVGMIAGALVVYYVGRWLDEQVIRVLLRRYGRWLTITDVELDRALHLVNRYGVWLVLFGRFIPVVRALIALPAGMARMPLRKFLFFLTLGALLYNTVQITIGLFLGEHWEVILSFIDEYEVALMIVGAVALAVGLIVVIARWRWQASVKNAIDA